VRCELTHSDRLVDRLSCSYEWIDDVHDYLLSLHGELLEDSGNFHLYQLWSLVVSGSD